MRIIAPCIALAALLPVAMQAQVAPTEEWQVCYGGSLGEDPWAMVRMNDGDLCIVSSTITQGTSGDVSGNRGESDAWVIKLDDVDGSLIWQRCVGGSTSDMLLDAVATADGGVLMAGESESMDGDVLGCAAGHRHWLAKMDAAGTLQWSTCGASGHTPWAIALTNDGGCITTGRTWGVGDLTVDKFDAAGTEQWSATFGGSQLDQGMGVLQTPDLGYLIAGRTSSNDGDVSGNHGGQDVWLIKLDSLGSLQWQRCLGGSGGEMAYGLVASPTGDHLLYGHTNSMDGDVTGMAGTLRMWGVMVDDLGNIIWEQCYGPDPAIAPMASCDVVIVRPDGFACGVYTWGSFPADWFFGMDLAGTVQWEGFYGRSHRIEGMCTTDDGALAWTSTGGPTFSTCVGPSANVQAMKLGWPHGPTNIGSTDPERSAVTVNVTDDLLHISTSALHRWNRMEIIDPHGRTVVQQPFFADQRPLNIAHLASGVYVLRLAGSTDRRSLRFALY